MEKKKNPEAMAEALRKIRLNQPRISSEEALAQRRAMMRTGQAVSVEPTKKQAA